MYFGITRRFRLAHSPEVKARFGPCTRAYMADPSPMPRRQALTWPRCIIMWLVV